MGFPYKDCGGIVGGLESLFWEFKDCGALEFFGNKDPIASRRWIIDMENDQGTSFCPE